MNSQRKSLLIGVIHGPTFELAVEQIEKAIPYADLLEIRLDCFDFRSVEQVSSLPKPKPFLFTFRKKEQGGRLEIDEKERLVLYETLLSLEPEWCDIEADTDLSFFVHIAKMYPHLSIMASSHNYEEMPEDLEELATHMDHPDVALYKLAVHSFSAVETLKLMIFSQNNPQICCVGLGEEGQALRILGPIVENPLTYASVEEASDPRLGQLSLETLCKTYHFHELSKNTKIYALLGDPVDKSIGHLFHNETFPKDAVYVKLRLCLPELPLFFSLMRQLPFAGFSVTMPLKERLGPFLTTVDPAAEAIGAINTIAREGDILVGYNTDGLGILNALEKNGPIEGKKMVILGAGGSSRAVAYTACQRGAEVFLLNRSLDRAEKVAEQFGCKAGGLELINELKPDILINTIPEELIYEPKIFSAKTLVMDIVYWTEETSLVRAAKLAGCKVINGTEAFYEQALLQQDIWFGPSHRNKGKKKPASKKK